MAKLRVIDRQIEGAFCQPEQLRSEQKVRPPAQPLRGIPRE